MYTLVLFVRQFNLSGALKGVSPYSSSLVVDLAGFEPVSLRLSLHTLRFLL